MDVTEIKATLDRLGSTWEEFKKANDERLAKLEKGRGAAELEEKVARINGDIDKLVDSQSKWEAERKHMQDRLDEFEANRDRLGPTAAHEHDRVKEQHAKAFCTWMRNPRDHKAEAALSEIEQKATGPVAGFSDITNATTAGHAVPEQIQRDIERFQLLISPVRDLVRVERASSPDYKALVDIRGTGAAWAGETTSRTASTVPQLRQVTATVGELYSYMATYSWTLRDLFFDVGAWLSQSAGEQFALSEGQAVLTGNGTNRPTGMLNATPVTTNDDASPLRPAAALEYVPLNIVSPVTANIQADELITLQYTLKSRHRARANWAMSSPTVGVVRKLKDTYGQYLWQPSIAPGVPSTLLGNPVAIWEDVADVAVNANAVLYGDFRSGYLLVDIGGMEVTVDDNITAPGQVKYYIRKRVGGIVFNNQAIKVGQISAA